MSSLISELLVEAPLLTDGAWGTQLQMRGLGPGECGDAWNLTHPAKVAEVAAAYVEAGSRIILTNTFRSNRVALAAAGLAEKTVDLNRAGAEISLSAATRRSSARERRHGLSLGIIKSNRVVLGINNGDPT
ncbi:MAG: homocysteine S-methyltransferase family protein, partial [Planctomycetales bacterium]|nr:homocysteine S-methyltransferase family protein [Planctomycetales bacterium]